MTRAAVAVVGGGTTGSLAVTHLRRRGVDSIVLLDPKPLGGGLAYESADEHHVLNVRAAGMSALPDEPDDFLHWLRADDPGVAPHDFVARRRFAAYLAHRVELTGAPEQLHERVCSLAPTSEGVELTTDGGRRVRVSAVVLALGPPLAVLPRCATAFSSGATVIRDPWQPGVLDRLVRACRERPGRRVLLIGTGLTMADVALSLSRADPTGTLHATSRHGLLPRAHRATATPLPPAPTPPDGPLRLDELRCLVARSVDSSVATTGDWRPGIDSLRPVTNALWQKLSADDQRAATSGAIRQWDVLRHRVAPAVDVALRDLLDDGRLVVRPLDEVRPDYDVVVNCTGFGARCTNDPLVDQLVRHGLARPHPLGTGLVVDGSGRPMTPSGVLPNVTVLGALRRGVLCETTAVPELRQQAAEAAALLTR